MPIKESARHVLEAMVVFHCPLPAEAVDCVPRSAVPDLQSKAALTQLSQPHIVQYHRDNDCYGLRTTDAAYIYEQIEPGAPADREHPGKLTRYTLLHHCAEYLKQSWLPPVTPEVLDQVNLDTRLVEFDLRCLAEDYEAAAATLLHIKPFLLLRNEHHVIRVRYARLLCKAVLEHRSSILFVGRFGGKAAKTTDKKRAFLGGLRSPNPQLRNT